MKSMDLGLLPEMFESVAAIMEQKAEKLCQMDARMGDGDLGLTMKKGFAALPQLIRDLEEPDVSKKLAKAGLKMSNVVPSTMGTLMASGIMSGAKALPGVTQLDAASYLAFLDGFCAGIIKRGKCAPGDRTVLDAVAAAVDALRAKLQTEPDISLSQAGEIAASGAWSGVEATKTMEPKFGKAVVHKAAAVGMADQGATAGYHLLLGCSNYFNKG